MLVARLGSVKAAARVLGVSEPAVSGALAALRQHLGDPLVARTPDGMELTPGGQRLLPIASQMVNLAAEAERAIRHAQGAPELLRVVATSTVAEYVARPLLTAFTAAPRAGRGHARGGDRDARCRRCCTERLADVGLGPRARRARRRADDALPAGRRGRPAPPAGPGGRVGRRRPSPGQDWLVDASGADPASEVGALLARLRVPDARIRVFPSLGAAWAAAADGEGVAPGRRPPGGPRRRAGPAGGAAGRRHARRPAVVRHHAARPTGGRRPPPAAALPRHAGRHAGHAPRRRQRAGVPLPPPVYVTLWS